MLMVGGGLILGAYSPTIEPFGNEVQGNLTVSGTATISGRLSATAGATLGKINGMSGMILDSQMVVGHTLLDANFLVYSNNRNAAKFGNGLVLGYSSSDYPSIGYGVRFQSGATYVYDQSDRASMLTFINGAVYCRVTATSGTAGNGITWTDAFTASNAGLFTAHQGVNFGNAATSGTGIVVDSATNSHYEEITFTSTLDYMQAVAPAIVFKIIRVGKCVTIVLNATITSDNPKPNTTAPVVANNLPVALRPSADTRIAWSIQDNSVEDIGYLQITSGGEISFRKPTSANWTNANVAKVFRGSGSYTIQ